MGGVISRWMFALGALSLSIAGCTNGGTSDTAQGGSSTSLETTTTAAPVILAIQPNLALLPNQCFDEIPVPETTTSTTTGAGTSDGGAATELTTPETLAETTTIPRPPTVAIVDCGGTNRGQVFAAFCLGPNEEASNRGSEDAAAQLTAVRCPGEPEFAYPGDRAIRRAAARICLQRFEELFGESYAKSRRIAQEFTPTEGVWGQQDHRVVCHSFNPPEPDANG